MTKTCTNLLKYNIGIILNAGLWLIWSNRRTTSTNPEGNCGNRAREWNVAERFIAIIFVLISVLMIYLSWDLRWSKIVIIMVSEKIQSENVVKNDYQKMKDVRVQLDGLNREKERQQDHVAQATAILAKKKQCQSLSLSLIFRLFSIFAEVINFSIIGLVINFSIVLVINFSICIKVN